MSGAAPEAEVYVSVDVEADGPIPGPYSMLSIGSVALDAPGAELAAFSANLERLPGAGQHPRMMAWWRQFPDAWAACRRDLQPPEQVMRGYAAWLRDLPGRPVFVGYPAVFDWMFVQWYLIRFVGRSPFSTGGIDLKTMAWAALGDRPFRGCGADELPPGMRGPLPHTHVALDDAREQAELFINLRRALRRGE